MNEGPQIVELSTKRCAYALSMVKWEHKGVILMTPEQSAELGILLREQRQRLGISTPRLARQVGTRQSTITRLEHGRFASPHPDKLARIAKALNLDRVEVFARAGYVMSDDLPSLRPYLAIKYPELSESAVAEIARQFEKTPIENSPLSTTNGKEGG